MVNWKSWLQPFTIVNPYVGVSKGIFLCFFKRSSFSQKKILHFAAGEIPGV